MKYTRTLYSDLEIESPTFLDIWCLLGGMVLVIIATSDAGTGFSGQPRAETFAALICPGILYAFNQFVYRGRVWLIILCGLSLLSIPVPAILYWREIANPGLNGEPLTVANSSILIFNLVAFVMVAKSLLVNNKL